MIGARGLRLERQFKLLVPVESKARTGEVIVAVTRPWPVPGNIGRVRGDLIGDQPLLRTLRRTEGL